MRDNWKQPAPEVYALLQQLNQGTAPENWPQRFYELGVGNFEDRWVFTSCLGVYGADLNIGLKVSTLSKSYFMDGRTKEVVKQLRPGESGRKAAKSQRFSNFYRGWFTRSIGITQPRDACRRRLRKAKR